MAAIIQEALGRLGPEGRVVLTATLLETLEAARRALLQENCAVDVLQLQVSRAQPLAGGQLLAGLKSGVDCHRLGPMRVSVRFMRRRND